MSDAVILPYRAPREPVAAEPAVTLTSSMAAVVLTDLTFVQSFCARHDMPASAQRDDLIAYLRRTLEPQPPPRRPARNPLLGDDRPSDREWA